MRLHGLVISSHPLRGGRHNRNSEEQDHAWQVRMSRPKWQYAQILNPDGRLSCGTCMYNDRWVMMAAIRRHLEQFCECDDAAAPEPCIDDNFDHTHNGKLIIGNANMSTLAGTAQEPRVMCVAISHVLLDNIHLTGEWAVSRVWRPGRSFPEYRSLNGWHNSPALLTRSTALNVLENEMKSAHFCDYPKS